MKTLLFLLLCAGQIITQNTNFKASRNEILNQSSSSVDNKSRKNLDPFNVDMLNESQNILDKIFTENGSHLESYIIKNRSGIKWINYRKVSFSFENNEKISVMKNWSENQWINYRRIITCYEGDNIVGELFQEWCNSEWISYYESKFKYLNGKRSEEIYRNGWRNLRNSYRQYYVYDINGNLQKEFYQNWIKNSWENIWKNEYAYDAFNRKIEIKTYDWIQGNWIRKGKKLFDYSKGNIENIIIQFYSDSEWENGYNYNYQYDNLNRLIKRSVSKWYNKKWTNYWQCLYEYYENNSFIRVTQIWNGLEWDNYWYCDQFFNNKYQRVEEINKSWTGSYWKNDDHELLSYNDNNEIIESLYQKWNGSDWSSRQKVVFNYSIPSGTDNIAAENDTYILFDNFPNPFNPSTIIKYSISAKSFVTLTVFDALGRKIASLVKQEQPKGNYEIEFNASALNRPISSGTYFYRILVSPYTSENGVSSNRSKNDFTETKRMIFLK